MSPHATFNVTHLLAQNTKHKMARCTRMASDRKIKLGHVNNASSVILYAKVKEKVRIFVQRPIVRTPKALSGSHSFYPANTPYLPLTRKRSPDGGATSPRGPHVRTLVSK